MWNETGNQTPALDVPASEAHTGGVRLESPFVGAADLLKGHQARASKHFMMRERAFLDLVNVLGALSNSAFVDSFERVVCCRPPAAPNTVARDAGYDVLWLRTDEGLGGPGGAVDVG